MCYEESQNTLPRALHGGLVHREKVSRRLGHAVSAVHPRDRVVDQKAASWRAPEEVAQESAEVLQDRETHDRIARVGRTRSVARVMLHQVVKTHDLEVMFSEAGIT
jgi:hypothetical protein